MVHYEICFSAVGHLVGQANGQHVAEQTKVFWADGQVGCRRHGDSERLLCGQTAGTSCTVVDFHSAALQGPALATRQRPRTPHAPHTQETTCGLSPHRELPGSTVALRKRRRQLHSSLQLPQLHSLLQLPQIHPSLQLPQLHSSLQLPQLHSSL